MNELFVFCEGSGACLQFGGVLTIGRASGLSLFAQDPLISREHCRLSREGSKLIVEDLGSKNKTRVNRRPLTPGERRQLAPSDVIEIGRQRLIVQPKLQAPAQAVAVKHNAIEDLSTSKEIERFLEQTQVQHVELEMPDFERRKAERLLSQASPNEHGMPEEPMQIRATDSSPRPASGSLGWVLLLTLVGAILTVLKGLPQ